MAQGLFVREEIGVALHGQVEALGQNIVSGAGGFLRTLHVQLIGLVAHGLAQVRVGLQPHLRLAHFLNGVQLVVPDGHMGVDVLPFQDAHQLHFDVVAAAVAHRALGGSRHDEVILVLGCALLNGTNGVFPDVAGEPLVHGRHSVTPSLQLLNGHRAHFQQAVGQKVLDALLGGSHLHPVCLGAGGVLQAALRHKLEHRPLCPRQCGAERCQHLLGLLHGRGGGQLLGRGGVRRQEVGLQKLQIHGLRSRSSNDEVLLCHQPLF